MTRGLAILEESASVPHGPPVPPRLDTRTLIKTIEQTCAGAVREVHVLFPSSTRIVVRLHPQAGSDTSGLVQRILTLPALEAYHVEVQVDAPE
jgi:hypothetical protein